MSVVREKNASMGRAAFYLLLSIVSVLHAGCSTTTLTGVWQDPDFSGRSLRKVLVVGVSAQDLYRRLLEDAFSRQLEVRGVEAVPSYTLFSDAELQDKVAVAEKVRGMGFDATLISRMTGRRTEEIQQPGHTYVRPLYQPTYYRKGWHSYYTQSYEIIHEPPYTVQYQVVTMASNLYDTAEDKLIWGAIADTVVQGRVESMLRSYVKVVMGSLGKANLF